MATLAHRLLSGAITLLPLCCLTNAHAQPGALDLSFNPGDVGFGRGVGTGGSLSGISAIALQPDGRVIIGGYFDRYDERPRGRVARVEADGTMDTTYAMAGGFNGGVTSCALQPDGKLIVGGYFTSYGGVSRPRLTRLNSDGTVDAPFALGNAPDDGVEAVALRADGKVLIAGYFTFIGTTPRTDVVLLNADGTLDATFDAGIATDGPVTALQVQLDNKVIIAGNFSTVAGVPRSGLARLNTDGTLDATFNSGNGLVDGEVETIALQPDGKLLVGGDFDEFDDIPANHILRLDTDGNLDPTFDVGTGFDQPVEMVALQPDGQVLASGMFTTCDGVAVPHLVRLQVDGSLDATFNIGEGGVSYATHVAVQPDGKLLLAGGIRFYGVHYRNALARTRPNGELDVAFNTEYGASVQATRFVQQPDGKILMAGYFTAYNDTVCEHLLRVDLNGHIDTTFHGWGDGPLDETSIRDLALMPDGRVVIGGKFNSYGGVYCYDVARLLPNGDPDTTFDPGSGTDNGVLALAVQPDGKVIIGGEFTVVGDLPRNYITRLNADGSVDTTFHTGTGANGYVNTIALQPDGRVVLGGNFTTVNSTTANHLVRLMPDGSMDPTFDLTYGVTGQTVNTVVLQPDGKLLVGGNFNSYDQVALVDNMTRVLPDGHVDPSFLVYTGADTYVTSFAVQPDGKIIVGGSFLTVEGTPRKHIARLHADGTVDTSFDPGVGPAGQSIGFVAAMGLLADGRVMISGPFNRVDGIGRNHVARLFGGESVGLAPLGQTVQDAWTVYPVPTTGSLSMGLLPGATTIELRDAAGMLVHRMAFRPTIELPPLAAGSYLLLARDAQGTLLGQERVIVGGR
jgi:uncharacterized delta-60 repeat protein